MPWSVQPTFILQIFDRISVDAITEHVYLGHLLKDRELLTLPKRMIFSSNEFEGRFLVKPNPPDPSLMTAVDES